MFDPVPWPIVWTAALVWLGVAFRRGFDMTSQQRRRASAVWYFVSVIPLAGVALWWAVMSNPAPTTKWVMLGVAGAVFGAAAFIAAGELISPTEGAMAQGNPPPSPPPTNGSPPTVNQGPGSAYSVDQRGGITAGTLNIGQP